MVHESKGTDPIKRSTIIGTRVWSLLVLESMDCRSNTLRGWMLRGPFRTLMRSEPPATKSYW
jgi:hypothetical protein